MSSAGIRVLGLPELQKSMEAAGVSMQNMAKANAAATAIIAAAARARAPRRTGRLSRSVAARSSARTGSVVATAVYAGVTEWGWPKHNRAASPFLLPAAHETEPSWLPLYQAEVAKALTKVKGA
jgi:hypothetical protein